MTTAPSGLTIQDEVTGDHRSLAVPGELDLSTTPDLVAVLDRAGGDGVRRVTLDLHAVAFIDSSALRALVVAGRSLAAGGCVLEIGPRSDMVSRVLAMTSLDEGNDAFHVLPVEG